MRRNLRKRKKWLRLISVFFSFFIWIYVVSSAVIENEKSIPLFYVVPDGYSLAEEYSKTITVIVKGPRLLVQKYLQREEKLEITLDRTYRTGKNKFSYNINTLLPRPAFGLELLSLSPKSLEVKIERTIFKKVPVLVTIPNSLKESLNTSSFEVTPRDIDISGPSSKVKLVTSISTESLEDFNMTSSGKQEVELIRPSSLIGLSSTSARLSYTVNSTVSEFTFKRIPIIFQSRKLIASANKRFVDLTLKGNKKTLDKLNPEELEVIASVQVNSQKVQVVELSVKLPQGLGLVSVMPNQVRITLE